MKKILSILLAVVMIMAMAACGTQPAPAPSAAPSAAPATGEPADVPEESYLTIRITADRASDEAQMLLVNDFAERVPEETNGRVQVEILTPGTMGSLSEMVDGIMMGTIDMAAIPDNIAGPFLSTNLGFLNLPGLFSSYDDVLAAFSAGGWMGDYINEVYAKDGLIRLGLVDNGFRTLGSKDAPLVELEDFKNTKIRVPEVEENIFQYKYMGALPVAISSSELLNALETNTVDAVDQSVTNYVANGIDYTIKYLYLIYDRYSSSSLLMNEATWNKLTPEDQEIVGRIGEEAALLQFNASRDIALGYIDKYSAEGTWVVAERADSVDAVLKDCTKAMLEEFGPKWDPEIVEIITEQVG